MTFDLPRDPNWQCYFSTTESDMDLRITSTLPVVPRFGDSFPRSSTHPSIYLSIHSLFIEYEVSA